MGLVVRLRSTQRGGVILTSCWSGDWIGGAGRWPGLVSTLQELTALGVGFVSVTAALDLTTPAGRAMVGLLSVFAEFERGVMRERVRAGFGGCALARDAPWATADDRWQSGLGQDLFLAGIRKSKIARRLKIDQTSVRLLEEKKS